MRVRLEKFPELASMIELEGPCLLCDQGCRFELGCTFVRLYTFLYITDWFTLYSAYFCQNTASAENNIKHLVYLLENAVLNLSEGQEQMSWLIDFTGFSFSTNIPIKTARDIIHILQNHYPERLGIAFLYNPPRIFQAFWKVCAPALQVYLLRFIIQRFYLDFLIFRWKVLQVYFAPFHS